MIELIFITLLIIGIVLLFLLGLDSVREYEDQIEELENPKQSKSNIEIFSVNPV